MVARTIPPARSGNTRQQLSHHILVVVKKKKLYQVLTDEGIERGSEVSCDNILLGERTCVCGIKLGPIDNKLG